MTERIIYSNEPLIFKSIQTSMSTSPASRCGRYLGVQALQVGTDVLDAGSKRVHVQERGDDP